jgi:hypothetical protein
VALDVVSALQAITTDLLFVTSGVAIEKLMPGEDEQSLNRLLDGRVHVIAPEETSSAYLAAARVRQRLLASSSIKGVLLLGDYATLPSRTIKSLDIEMFQNLKDPHDRPIPDIDEWWAWNDDIYGNKTAASLLPDLPVSRLPIAPSVASTPYTEPNPRVVLGLRASEFGFADVIYQNVLGRSGTMRQSPPASTPLTVEPPSNIAVEIVLGPTFEVDWLYLVLHHLSSATLTLTGTTVATSSESWTPSAIDGGTFRGMADAPALIFGGVCWGCLTAAVMASTHFHSGGGVPDVVEVRYSVPMSFLNKGANSFVGFTTYHNIEGTMGVPRRQFDDLLLGAPLHWYFWENIVEGMPPAKALFMAKASVIGALDPETMHPVALAQTLKVVWSATCLGFGW